MTKAEKRAAKAAAALLSNATPLNTGSEGNVPSVVVETPPVPETTVVETVAAQPKVRKTFVYDRDAINERIKAEKAAGTVRLHPNKARYVKATATSSDARSVFDNADAVALELRSVDLAGLWEFAALHLPVEVIAAKQIKYAGKNIGMVRMNIGNLVRGAIRSKARQAAIAAAAATLAAAAVQPTA